MKTHGDPTWSWHLRPGVQVSWFFMIKAILLITSFSNVHNKVSFLHNMKDIKFLLKKTQWDTALG